MVTIQRHCGDRALTCAGCPRNIMRIIISQAAISFLRYEEASDGPQQLP